MTVRGDETPLADELLKGLWRDNPVFVRVLAMCPALAVSNSAVNALTMGLATTFVLTASNTVVSALRTFIPGQVRIATYVVIIATFVTVVDYAIQALSLEVHRNLGAFISLIVVNCLILARAEAFASRHAPLRSFLDGLGMGLGFAGALFAMGAVREILGSGELFGMAVMPENFQTWSIMLLPGGGFFTLGVWLLLFNAYNRRQKAQPGASGAAARAGAAEAGR